MKSKRYSRMGVVVGHENTHGFDNSGSYWNAYGLPGDVSFILKFVGFYHICIGHYEYMFDNFKILDPATRANFLESAVCIANFYSQYVVYENTTIPGNHTLGENIADIGTLFLIFL